MSGDAADDPTDVDGPAAPPRANGELVFSAPWQSRLFAATLRLRDAGRLEWELFRRSLIDQIAAHEAAIDDPTAYDYWGCWQRALEDQLAVLGLVSPAELGSRAEALAARPPGHDHHHDEHHADHHHDHDHDHNRPADDDR